MIWEMALNYEQSCVRADRMIQKKDFNGKGTYIQQAPIICAFMYIETFNSTNGLCVCAFK